MRAARFALVRAPAAARLRRPPLARGAAARWSDKAKADSDAAAADAARDAKFDAADAARDAKFDQRDAKADAKTAKEDTKAQQAAKDEAMAASTPKNSRTPGTACSNAPRTSTGARRCRAPPANCGGPSTN